MKVYEVYGGWHYEGDDAIAIYDNPEAAAAHVAHLRLKQERDDDDAPSYDNIGVCEHEVFGGFVASDKEKA